MKDILNVFLELTLEDVPLFVANNLHNLPPLSMDNFDMSRLIRDMESIKLQMKVLQEAQETSLSAHVANCSEKSHDTVVGASPAHSTGTPPSPVVVRTPMGSPRALIIYLYKQRSTLILIVHLTLLMLIHVQETLLITNGLNVLQMIYINIVVQHTLFLVIFM